MENKAIAIKAALSVAATYFSATFGWRGTLALIWFGCMVLDYLSGTMAALMAGSWSSKVARSGIFHKAGMLLVVLVALLADMGLQVAVEQLALGIAWPALLLPMVLVWYILTEVGSMLENAAHMGAPVPKWLIKLLDVSLQAVDKMGEESGE